MEELKTGNELFEQYIKTIKSNSTLIENNDYKIENSENLGIHIQMGRYREMVNFRRKFEMLSENSYTQEEKNKIFLELLSSGPSNEGNSIYEKVCKQLNVEISERLINSFTNKNLVLNKFINKEEEKEEWKLVKETEEEILNDRIKKYIKEIPKYIEKLTSSFIKQNDIYTSSENNIFGKGSQANEFVALLNINNAESNDLIENDCLYQSLYMIEYKIIDKKKIPNIPEKKKKEYLENAQKLLIEMERNITLKIDDIIISPVFILDQYFNFIHKTKKKDYDRLPDGEIKDLYGNLLNLLGVNIPSKNSTKKNIEPNNNPNMKKSSLNTILYGPPGTGKTYNTINKAVDIVASSDEKKEIEGITDENQKREKYLEFYKNYAGNAKKENLFKKTDTDEVNQIEFVTFHQNYTYEDFVIGLKPNTEKDDQLVFKVNHGIFYKMCKKAHEVGDKNYVLIIDEINRANISRVFGELITLLEDDKRIGTENELIVTLPNGETFGVPKNLYIIGTMNTADKSIALIDIALRRRFEFEGKYPNATLIEPKHMAEDEKKELATAQKLLNQINKNIITAGKSADFTIGHAFFMKNMKIVDVIEKKIIPLLLEYFNNNTDKVTKIFEGSGYEAIYNEDEEKPFTWKSKIAEKKVVKTNEENGDSQTDETVIK